jgi:flavin reductase (DIM6/NTAB) family NADH-FMN oxidoreductase RutF
MITIDPNNTDRKQVYKLMTGSIVPRAIAWVSSLNPDGQANLAPFSFFTAVSSEPPTILFCPSRRSTDEGEKDTYHNVLASGEFVVNFVTESTAEAMNITATEFPAEVNEFERAGLTPIPSVKVKAPRVLESPIHFECKLVQTLDIGDGHIVIGEVVYMHFSEMVYRTGHYIDTLALQPIGRLAGNNYSRINDLFQIVRPPSEIKAKE